MNSDGEFGTSRDPVPRECEADYKPFHFPIKSVRWLPRPNNVSSRPCLDVLHSRRSIRIFDALTETNLSDLLWFSAKSLNAAKETSGFLWEHRPAPSAGGRHPIYIVVFESSREAIGTFLYHSQSHALQELEVRVDTTNEFFAKLDSILSPGSGTVLWLVADRQRTLSRYEHGDSLIWRDAGALLGTISIAAEALALNCCAYGITGNSWVAEILPPTRFVGVGGCVVGARRK
jgi:SagB-type dehydrogenase family enzyme